MKLTDEQLEKAWALYRVNSEFGNIQDHIQLHHAMNEAIREAVEVGCVERAPEPEHVKPHCPTCGQIMSHISEPTKSPDLSKLPKVKFSQLGVGAKFYVEGYDGIFEKASTFSARQGDFKLPFNDTNQEVYIAIERASAPPPHKPIHDAFDEPVMLTKTKTI